MKQMMLMLFYLETEALQALVFQSTGIEHDFVIGVVGSVGISTGAIKT